MGGLRVLPCTKEDLAGHWYSNRTVAGVERAVVSVDVRRRWPGPGSDSGSSKRAADFLRSSGDPRAVEELPGRRDEVPVRRGAQRLSQVSAAPASHGLAACLRLLSLGVL